MATSPKTPIDFGWRAPDFSLPGTDGRSHSMQDVCGPNGMLILFICNHCPYVLAILERLVTDIRELQELGIGVAAICANDANAYPQDSFEKMGGLAVQYELPFPYLHDEDQSVARAYGAVCTPDFFGFDQNLGLQYRGRLDAGRLDPPPADRKRELVAAMRQVVETGKGPEEQTASIGCSIKWRTA